MIRVEVQTDEEWHRLDEMAKKQGVINGGTSRLGIDPLPRLTDPSVIDAGTSRTYLVKINRRQIKVPKG